MKKFLAALLIALSGFVPLFAADVADVKTVLVKICELMAKGDFAGALALHTPDYQETAPDGITVNYQLLQWFAAALDGKHPEEWRLVFFVTVENKGVMPDAEMEAKLRKAAGNPEYIKLYKTAVPLAVKRAQTGAAFRLKNLQIVSVEVDGDRATAVTETASPDFKTGALRKYRATAFLRKVDGKWMFHRSVGKYK